MLLCGSDWLVCCDCVHVCIFWKKLSCQHTRATIRRSRQQWVPLIGPASIGYILDATQLFMSITQFWVRPQQHLWYGMIPKALLKHYGLPIADSCMSSVSRRWAPANLFICKTPSKSSCAIVLSHCRNTNSMASHAFRTLSVCISIASVISSLHSWCEHHPHRLPPATSPASARFDHRPDHHTASQSRQALFTASGFAAGTALG